MPSEAPFLFTDVRSQNFSTSQKTLEEALENLTQYINEGLSPIKTAAAPNQALSLSTMTESPLGAETVDNPITETDNPSNMTADSSSNMTADNSFNMTADSPSNITADSLFNSTTEGISAAAMGTATKDIRQTRSPILTLSRQLYASADSAFSNNSSHSSIEAVSDTVSDVVSCSEMNTLSCNSALGDKGFVDNAGYTATLLKGTGGLVSTHSMPTLTLDTLSGNESYAFEGGSGDRGKFKKLSGPNSKWRQCHVNEHYGIHRSPILSGKESRHHFYDALAGIPSSDRTPAPPQSPP